RWMFIGPLRAVYHDTAKATTIAQWTRRTAPSQTFTRSPDGLLAMARLGSEGRTAEAARPAPILFLQAERVMAAAAAPADLAVGGGDGRGVARLGRGDQLGRCLVEAIERGLEVIRLLPDRRQRPRLHARFRAGAGGKPGAHLPGQIGDLLGVGGRVLLGDRPRLRAVADRLHLLAQGLHRRLA